MFIFPSYCDSETTTLEFPASGGAQITQFDGSIVRSVYAVSVSGAPDYPFSHASRWTDVTPIDSRIEEALLALKDKLYSKEHSPPVRWYEGYLEYKFKEPVEFLGHADIVYVRVSYTSPPVY